MTRSLIFVIAVLAACVPARGNASCPEAPVVTSALRRDGPGAIPFFTVWMSRDVTFVAPVDTQKAVIAKWRQWYAKASDGFVFTSAGSLDDWYF